MQIASKPRVGLIGLGLMGHGIGRNLLKHGFSLTVLGNVKRTPVESLIALGAVDGVRLDSLVRAVDMIVLCVTGSPQVEALVYGEGGILASARAGQILIDCSTSDPRSSAAIEQDLAKAGVTFVDAPLGRTPKEAESGSLNVMVGSSPEVLEKIRPVLEAFCENIIHVGDALSAHRLKLINNFVVIGTVALLAQALRTCDQVGVSRASLCDLMRKGPLQSPLLEMTVQEIIKGNLDGMKFSIRNAQKDLSYFDNMAAGSAQAASLSGDLVRVLTEAVAQGLGERFLPSLTEVV
jgi:3-hydroxyisobutyrate dehydrogenase-like beta-hydroxyacid dehydrogenase